MDKELNIEEYLQNELDSFYKDVLFYGETPGKMKDLESVILEKLWAYEGVKPSEYNLKDNADGWKKIANALLSALVIDYGIDKAEYDKITKEDGKLNYSSLYRSVNTDDPESIVKRINILLAHKELDPEQILFGLGLILDKNKEAYISILKNDITELKGQLKEVVNENNKFRERLNKAEARKTQFPLKKRVIVVRKKEIEE